MSHRIPQQQLESYLWGAAVLLRGTIDAGDYKQFIFPLLFYKRVCDVFDEETQAALAESGGDKRYASGREQHRFQIPPDAHWREVRQAAKNVGAALQSAMRAIETANPDKLYGIFGDAKWTNKDRLSDSLLRDMVEHFSSLDLTVANLPEDELGQGYEYLIKKFADDAGHTAAEFYTNRTVVHLMTEMLDVQPGESVYDPTCGSGGMLLSCITHLRRLKKEWRNVRLCGQERNLMTSSIARMNCFLHGIEDFRIERGDTLAVLVKNPERVRAVVEHIVTHFQQKVEPNGFKAQVVTFDRECCVLYKAVMDELIGPEASAIVISAATNDPDEWKVFSRDKDAEEKLLDRFRDPADPLKFVIVTAKLLTGFDAPILQAMYLDKPLRDHNLLQAICRTNRTFGQEKTHGLIVDYIGIFDDVAQALAFDEKSVRLVVSSIDELRKVLPVKMQKCLSFFPGVDRTVGGYEGLMVAQQCLPNNEVRDKFATEYTVLGNIWEALSPDPCLSPYQTDYRWLTQVYESVKPPSGNGKLLWHALGAKTIELINENVHVESVRDDVETLIMDAQVIEDFLKSADPAKRGKEIEIKLIARLRKHFGNPKFTELGERLERIKERHEQGLLTSVEFLKQMLELAKDVVEAEKQADPVEERDRAKEALTELFQEAKTKNTQIIVERIVADIDDIVKKVRFDGWKNTSQGEREVQQALRRTLLKYKLHTDQDLFDKAYGYIRQYY